MKARRTTELDRLIGDHISRQATAHHEAGHAVVGFVLGYEFYPTDDPVLILYDKDTGRCKPNGLCLHPLVVDMAGWTAESIYRGGQVIRDLPAILARVRRNEFSKPSLTDDEKVFFGLLQGWHLDGLNVDELCSAANAAARATDEELLTWHSELETQTFALLGQRHVWRAVETLAGALHRKQTLRSTEVNDILFGFPDLVCNLSPEWHHERMRDHQRAKLVGLIATRSSRSR